MRALDDHVTRLIRGGIDPAEHVDTSSAPPNAHITMYYAASHGTWPSRLTYCTTHLEYLRSTEKKSNTTKEHSPVTSLAHRSAMLKHPGTNQNALIFPPVGQHS